MWGPTGAPKRKHLGLFLWCSSPGPSKGPEAAPKVRGQWFRLGLLRSFSAFLMPGCAPVPLNQNPWAGIRALVLSKNPVVVSFCSRG